MLSRLGIDIHLPALLVRIAQLVITFGLAELVSAGLNLPFVTRDFVQVYVPGRQRSNGVIPYIRDGTDHFINVHRPIGWEYYVNKQFAEGVARWPQAELIDWDATAHTQQEWFIED